MLFGHTGAVTCLAMANNTADNTFIVSSADNGYIETTHCLIKQYANINNIRMISEINFYYF